MAATTTTTWRDLPIRDRVWLVALGLILAGCLYTAFREDRIPTRREDGRAVDLIPPQPVRAIREPACD
jgi:hypothetical protein